VQGAKDLFHREERLPRADRTRDWKPDFGDSVQDLEFWASGLGFRAVVFGLRVEGLVSGVCG